MMDNSEFEKFIAERLAKLPRKSIPSGDKVSVWLKIQANLRQTRLEAVRTRRILGLVPAFHFGRLVIGALAIVIALGAVGAAGKASEGSLPGDTLYSVKRATEQVETIFAINPESKVKIGIKHAQTRLAEVQSLVEQNKQPDVVAQAVADLKSTTEQVINAASGSQPELVDNAVQLVNQEKQVLATVQDKAAGDAKTAIQDAIASSAQSLDKLQGSDQGAVVKGTATEQAGNASSTNATISPSGKTTDKDGVIQSNMQIQDVTKVDQNGNPHPENPTILSEPSVGF